MPILGIMTVVVVLGDCDVTESILNLLTSDDGEPLGRRIWLPLVIENLIRDVIVMS